ncbi:MAG: PAS domain S-box protein [Chloroflexi bacterium]|nr:PAS domain S-box protein [Chloroflexota bacterium]
MTDVMDSQAQKAMARLAAIVESSDDAIVGKTLNGVVESWNRGAERLYGYAAVEIMGRPISILVPPDRVDDLPHILERIKRGERVEHYETVRMRKDGTRLDVSLTVSPIKDADRNIIGASTIARDVTERRRIEQEQAHLLQHLQAQNEELSRLHEGQARLAAIVESSDDAIIGKTLDGVIISWNAGAERLYGYASAEVVDRNISLLVPPGRSDELPEILRRLARGERVEHYETTRARKGGSLLDVSITASPIKDTSGKIVGASTITRDFTYRKRIERQLADANQQLQVQLAKIEEQVAVRTAALTLTNRHLKQEIEQRQRAETWLEQKNIELTNAKLAKERFLASMGHELRALLNVVVDFNDMLMKLPEPFSEQQEKHLHTIRLKAQHLPFLVNDLLDLAKIESGTLEIKVEPVDLASVIREVMDLLRPMAEQKGLKFADNTPGHVVVRTDRQALRRILLNLTDFAISLTEMGRVDVEVARRHRTGELVTEISVVGRGSSFGEEYQKSISEAYRQLDGTALRPAEGAGLGLHLSQRLAHMIKSEISLESRAGSGGSAFTLTLK